jgi:uncharacterized membrane protein YhaH (DUF805 family)
MPATSISVLKKLLVLLEGIKEIENMGIIEMMKFDSEVSLSRGAWWGWTLGLIVVQIVVGIILAIASIFSDGMVDIVSMIFTLMVVWIVISVSVGRLRDRGYTEIMEFALRLILFPWGLVECGFLAGQE